MNDTKHLFIVNPKAGKGAALKTEKTIESLFKALSEKYSGISYEIVRTEYPGHGTEIAREYSNKGIYRIYAVGGDGTLNEVLNGMAGTESSLAIIPCGTGNDFIKSIAGKFNKGQILKDSILGTEKNVDLCRINDKYFINIASVGFDAKVNFEAASFKSHPFLTTEMAYFAGIIKSLKSKETIDLKIEIDGVDYSRNVFLIAFCNGRYYGGSFMMSPHSDLSDGLLDVVIVDDVPMRKIATYLPLLMKGKHLNIPEITYLRAKHIVVTSEKEKIINIDGESIQGNIADVSIESGKLKLIIPRGY